MEQALVEVPLDVPDPPAEVVPPTADAADAAPAAAPVFPSFPALLQGIAGYVALGVATLVSAEGITDPLALAASALVAAGGTVAMTTPTLLVAHQYAALSARPAAVLAVVLSSLARTGGLALWLSPVLLFFAASSGVWAVIFWIAMLWLGLVGLSCAALGVVALEEEQWATGRLLALGWSGLSCAVGIHLTLTMFRMAMEG